MSYYLDHDTRLGLLFTARIARIFRFPTTRAKVDFNSTLATATTR